MKPTSLDASPDAPAANRMSASSAERRSNSARPYLPLGRFATVHQQRESREAIDVGRVGIGPALQRQPNCAGISLVNRREEFIIRLVGVWKRAAFDHVSAVSTSRWNASAVRDNGTTPLLRHPIPT